MRRWMKGLAVSCLIALIYIVAMLVTMPADALRHFVSIPSQITAFNGTIRYGRADLIGGYALTWDHRAGDLLRLRGTVDAALNGPDTQLTGTIQVTPLTVSVLDMTGQAGAGLMLLLPLVAIVSCTTRAVVDVTQAGLSRSAAWATGHVTVDAGTCTETNGRVDPVPPLDIALMTVGSDARAYVTSERQSMAEFVVAGDRRLILTLQPEGSALIPGLPTSAPIMLEYSF